MNTKSSENKFLCIKNSLKFELELSTFHFQNLHALKFTKISGDNQIYLEFMKELSKTINKNIKNY